jgi:hypothetical protein
VKRLFKSFLARKKRVVADDVRDLRARERVRWGNGGSSLNSRIEPAHRRTNRVSRKVITKAPFYMKMPN